MTDDSPEVKALKEQVARAQSERDLAKAQLDEWEAKKKLADGKASADLLSKAAVAKAQAEAQTAVFAQEKAAADAKSAAATAELAALKAKFGTVSASGVSGTVTTDSGAGSGEAGLLAAQAVDAAARKIKEALPALDKDQRYIIFAGSQRPNLGAWRTFQLQRELVLAAFDAASYAKKRADDAGERVVPGAEEAGGAESAGAALTGAGALLDLASKLGSYFQSDYKLGQATVSGSDDDLLAVSVARLLTGSWFPDRWVPQGSDTTLSGELAPLQETRWRSLAEQRDAKDESERWKADAEKATDASKKADCNDISGLYAKAMDAYSAAQKRFDDLLESLAKTDKDGVPAAASIIEQKVVSDALASGSFALFLRLNLSAGGYYTKKNLWTFFGGMPFYVSGGAIASFVAVDGASGDVRAAGQFQVHSGYYKVDEVQNRFLIPTARGETSGNDVSTSGKIKAPEEAGLPSAQDAQNAASK